jgi:hypothetical protein
MREERRSAWRQTIATGAEHERVHDTKKIRRAEASSFFALPNLGGKPENGVTYSQKSRICNTIVAPL